MSEGCRSGVGKVWKREIGGNKGRIWEFFREKVGFYRNLSVLGVFRGKIGVFLGCFSSVLITIT